MDCKPAELFDILTFPSGGLMLLPSNAMDEVYPGIYIGEESAARDLKLLRKKGITHVLNAAKGKDRYHVDTNQDFYKADKIKFLSIEATDIMNFKICNFFDRTSEFITQGLASGGKVLVHCREGVSRSATLVLAYLMLKQGLSVQDAVRTVRSSREICPNEGFLQQLCDLDKKLQTKQKLAPEKHLETNNQ